MIANHQQLYKYSIIIPVYKAENYISKCIESILAQTVNNWELLLIDDGSPDKSGVICDKYAANDVRIKVFHKKNEGVSTARNLGITKASGIWITFIDSDDWVDSNYLESFNCPDDTTSKAIYVQGIARSVPDGRHLDDIFTYQNVTFTYHDIDSWRKYEILKNGCPVAKLFNRELLIMNELLFDEELTLNEDHLFVTDYYRYVEKIYLVQSSCYHYFFDYKVESLTKKKHSSIEYLNIASKISLSLKRLCDRLEVCPTDICTSDIHYIYGLGQIISASLNCIRENNSYMRYKICADLYNGHDEIKLISGTNLYSRLFVSFVKNKNYSLGFLLAIIYGNACMVHRYIINAIKKYILKL